MSVRKQPPHIERIGDARPTYQARVRGRPDRAYVSMTFFIRRDAHRRLKELAAQRDTSQQELMTEALDMWLAKQGEPALEAVSFKKVDHAE